MIPKPLLFIATASAAGLFYVVARSETTLSEKATPPPSPLANATLAPTLKAAAERDGIVLYDTAKIERREPVSGDALLVWVAASDGKTTRQWLIQFRRGVTATGEQRSARGSDRIKYLSWGPIVTFSSNVESLDLWLAGPVDMNDRTAATRELPPTRRLRVRVPGDYLRLGLDDSARVTLHLNHLAELAKREQRPLDFEKLYSTDKPVSAERMREAKRVADRVGFTPESERAWVGGHVALQAFYDMANTIPEIREIALIAIERPSVWKLAKYLTGTRFHGGLGGPKTRTVDPAALGMMPVALEGFALPFSMRFGDDPIVQGELIVVSPLPPLDVTAGVLGLIAQNPRHPEKRVHLIAIGATNGDSAPFGAPNIKP
jgi:hypothetical protein